MKYQILGVLLFVVLVCYACSEIKQSKELSVVGTWRLIDAHTIEKDTSFSTFDSTREMIKILNSSHFAFLNHTKAKIDSTKSFYAGGGTYMLVDSTYTERLQYFNDKAWENTTFNFTVKILNDTLIQTGREKVDKLGIDRIIIEKYVRLN